MSGPSQDLPGTGSRYGKGILLPDEEADLEARLDRVREEKQKALAEPGPSWREWFLFSGAKWYVVLGYLIVFAWEASYAGPDAHVALYIVAPVVAVTLYAEFLLYRFLWYRPKIGDHSRSRRSDGRWRRWLYPVRYGRWTPEADAVRAGHPILVPEAGPDPREFV